jgi:pyruvate/2-oxoglutarate/acetoin dehydrogenase E1 component
MSPAAPARPASPSRGLEGTFVGGLNQALRYELDNDPSLLLLGEDIAQLGGLFRVTEGLAEAHPDRVLDTPIAEAGFTGVAIGAAMAGHHVMVEMQVIDFLWLAADQLANAAGLHFASGGQISVPIVLRGPCGLGTGFGVTHSQRLEAVLASRPGMKVVMPSTPGDAKGLLTSALRDPGPVIMFEDSILYYRRGPLPPDGTAIPIGEAKVAREGSDVTLATTGRGLGICLEAAQALSDDRGIEVEVIDLRSLKPLDWDMLEDSVATTRRFAIALDGPSFCSYGSYVAAEMGRRRWSMLDAPPLAITGIDVPGAPPEPAEAAVAITPQKVSQGIASLVDGSAAA